MGEHPLGRILFVDDELAVLSGMALALRRLSRGWDLDFAPGGLAAMEAMDRQSYDAVVTDLRMPGVDGTQVLRFARERCPSTARLVLSGHPDFEGAGHWQPLAHQLLDKPTSPPSLWQAILRALEIREGMSPALLGHLMGVRVLPTLPTTCFDALHAARDLASIEALTEVIAQAPSMCAKVLQYANSGLFGGWGEVCSVAEAVESLGLPQLQRLLLEDGLAELFSLPCSQAALHIQTLNHHARTTSSLVRAMLQDHPQVEQAAAAGLLVDVGQLLLLGTEPGLTSRLLEESEHTGASLLHLERQALGFDHTQLGASLLRLWGLPESLVRMVASHHALPPPEGPLEPSGAVALASALASEWSSWPPETAFVVLVQGGWRAHLPCWRELARGLAAQ